MFIVYVPFVFAIVEGIQKKEYLLSVVFVGIIIVISYLFYSIQYRIEGGSVFIWRTKIEIKSIRKIYKTRNPLSSPALSINRIAIVYNKFDEVLISPKDRAAIVQELVLVNPAIEVDL